VTISHSFKETIKLAEKFAKNLKGGVILALTGDLGAGKTTFIKGLAEGLKVNETITSPTFVILKSYPAKIKDKNIEFVHIDAYRTETTEDIKSVAIEDYLRRDDIIIAIEWAEKIKKILPKNTINIKFEFVDEKTRKITINNFIN